MTRRASRPDAAVARLPDPDVARWDDEDFSLSRMSENSRNGSMPPGYFEAYGDYLRRIGLLPPIKVAPLRRQ
jgi:hypothetical protein